MKATAKVKKKPDLQAISNFIFLNILHYIQSVSNYIVNNSLLFCYVELLQIKMLV